MSRLKVYTTLTTLVVTTLSIYKYISMNWMESGCGGYTPTPFLSHDLSKFPATFSENFFSGGLNNDFFNGATVG